MYSCFNDQIIVELLGIIGLGVLLVLPGLLFSSAIVAGAISTFIHWGIIPGIFISGGFLVAAVYFFSEYKSFLTSNIALDIIPILSACMSNDFEDIKQICKKIGYDTSIYVDKNKESILKNQNEVLKNKQVVNNAVSLEKNKDITKIEHANNEKSLEVNKDTTKQETIECLKAIRSTLEEMNTTQDIEKAKDEQKKLIL